MSWESLPDSDRVLPANKSYVLFSPTQILFSAGFLKMSDAFYLRATEYKIYVNVFVNKDNHKIGFEFTTEYAPGKGIHLHFQKRGWTGYISSYRIIRAYPSLKDMILNLNIDKRKFTPKKEGELWVIDLSEYWRQ